MSATREYRNAGAIEDAAASIGTTITVAEHLMDALSAVLPDDFDFYGARAALANVRNAHAELQDRLGV